jgi:hypothetical protein
MLPLGDVAENFILIIIQSQERRDDRVKPTMQKLHGGYGRIVSFSITQGIEAVFKAQKRLKGCLSRIKSCGRQRVKEDVMIV